MGEHKNAGSSEIQNHSIVEQKGRSRSRCLSYPCPKFGQCISSIFLELSQRLIGLCARSRWVGVGGGKCDLKDA